MENFPQVVQVRMGVLLGSVLVVWRLALIMNLKHYWWQTDLIYYNVLCVPM
jgi:hypothetical protein